MENDTDRIRHIAQYAIDCSLDAGKAKERLAVATSLITDMVKLIDDETTFDYGDFQIAIKNALQRAKQFLEVK
jgi:hypothetical protein